jgi:hypothetical protein
MLLRLLAGRGPLSDELALRAVVGSCWRVSLLYRELCRRYGKTQARVIVEEELRCFLGHLAHTA